MNQTISNLIYIKQINPQIANQICDRIDQLAAELRRQEDAEKIKRAKISWSISRYTWRMGYGSKLDIRERNLRHLKGTPDYAKHIEEIEREMPENYNQFLLEQLDQKFGAAEKLQQEASPPTPDKPKKIPFGVSESELDILSSLKVAVLSRDDSATRAKSFVGLFTKKSLLVDSSKARSGQKFTRKVENSDFDFGIVDLHRTDHNDFYHQKDRLKDLNGKIIIVRPGETFRNAIAEILTRVSVAESVLQ